MLEKALVVAVAGFLVGAVNAIAGGGMLVGFPVLIAFGLSAIVSNATSNVVTIAGQFTASVGYREQIRKLPKAYFGLIIPSIVGGVIGAYVLRKTPDTKFLLIAPALIFVAVVLFAFQPYIKQRIYRLPEQFIKFEGPSFGIYILVFLLSIYGGYFGAGYGLVILAILSLSKIDSIHQMNGLKNLCAFAVCLSAIAVLFNSHLIDWHYGLTMAVGSAVGGYVGSRLALRFRITAIRYIVIFIGTVTAIYLYSQTHLS